jgi:hypothetical protein
VYDWDRPKCVKKAVVASVKRVCLFIHASRLVVTVLRVVRDQACT